MSYPTLRDNYLLSARSDGRVEWIFPEIFKSYCSLDIKFFPFDRLIIILENFSFTEAIRK